MRYLLFSIGCYLCGISAIVATFLFMQFYLDTTVDSFDLSAASLNFLLFLIFPLQHSLLARTGWKSWIHRRIHPLMERPLYVGTTGLVLGAVLWLWKPFGPILYSTPHRFPFDAAFFLSVILIIWTSLALGHFTLFGMTQGVAAWKGASLSDPPLNRNGPFRLVRHPLTTLLILAVWSHHALTASRLEWNLLLSAYSLIGVVFEERDLVKKYGDEYLEYRRNVPAFIPLPRFQTRA
ncbi:MAG TPA: isoprenylcysteine carboxylmethyltransferase family protein [Acidobacteriota bacterium]|nr:isoprenylcysteine carboxylmethyltransferase family protein [Acidobacteriota bacterium]